MRVELIKTLAESRPVRTKRPINFDIADERWFPAWGDYQTNDQEIFLIHDANVTDKGVVFDNLVKFDKAFVHSNLVKQYNLLYLLKVNLFYKRMRTDNNQVYVLAFDPWSGRNYYHWVIDTLPRLFVLKQDLPDSIVLLPRNAGRYMYESLQFFNPKAVLELKKRMYVRVKKLNLPRPLADSGRHDGKVLLALKNFILNQVESRDDTKGFGEKLYISRAHQVARKIHNETEVQELLKGYGFRVVFFEDMSFVEQITVMRNARYVVSSHGANLTNILFMPEKAKVLEINRNQSPNLCYWSLATGMNLDYFYQLCPDVDNGRDKDNNSDLVVDVNKLRENVEAMLH